MDSAKDIYRNEATQKSTQPICYGALAYLSDNNNFRVDTIRRGNNFYPFYVSVDENLEL